MPDITALTATLRQLEESILDPAVRADPALAGFLGV